MKIELQNISIAAYSKMLKLGTQKETIEEINKELNKSLGSLDGGSDLYMFMLQKDLLIFQCKLAIAIFSYDEKKTEIYTKKIDVLKKEIESKQKKIIKLNPYKSFIDWLLAVEKYLGFSIDKNNDLLYLSGATKQMLNHYEQQKKQYENNKGKK